MRRSMIDVPVIRERVIALHSEGKTNQEIADDLGVYKGTVQGWLHDDLKLTPNRERRVDGPGMIGYQKARAARKQENLKKVRQLTLQGVPAQAIGEELGLSRRTVTDYRLEAGVRMNDYVDIRREVDGRPPGASEERLAERRERVAEMVRLGYSTTRIARVLGTSVRSIQSDRRKLGVPVPSGRRWPEGVAERALEMLEDGAGYEETARTLGVNSSYLARKYPGMGWTREQLYEYNAALKRYAEYVT